jgi:hypothetical protein
MYIGSEDKENFAGSPYGLQTDSRIELEFCFKYMFAAAGVKSVIRFLDGLGM